MGFFLQNLEISNVNSVVQTFVQITPQPVRNGKRNVSPALHVQKFSLQESMTVLQNYVVVDAKPNSLSLRKSFELKFNALLASEVFV
jgi:hypothetical protein